MSGRLRELFDQYSDDMTYGYGTKLCMTREAFEAAARALLAEAQPEPAGSTDPAWREFIEAVQHAQHVAKREGECPPFDLVETAFALWRSAAPEPVSVDERLRLVAAGIRCGYMAGHDATVEGRYGDPDEVAAECATQVLQEQADG